MKSLSIFVKRTVVLFTSRGSYRPLIRVELMKGERE